MAKITKREDIHIELYPPYYYLNVSEETIISDLESMCEDIKRHVDNVDRGNYPEVKWKAVEYCEFCNSPWDGSFVPGTGWPVCCQSAQEEFLNNNNAVECLDCNGIGEVVLERDENNRANKWDVCPKCKGNCFIPQELTQPKGVRDESHPDVSPRV